LPLIAVTKQGTQGKKKKRETGEIGNFQLNSRGGKGKRVGISASGERDLMPSGGPRAAERGAKKRQGPIGKGPYRERRTKPEGGRVSQGRF